MADLTRTNVVDGEDLGLTRGEFAILARLTTPQKIQAFVNTIPVNHEPDGETIRSVREVLRVRRAHCIEGAFLAACAMWVHGAPPLVMHMDCDPSDYPHVVALFRSRSSWGAISKSNGAVLRFRDPDLPQPARAGAVVFPRVLQPAGKTDVAQLFCRVRSSAHRSAALGHVRGSVPGGA